MREIVRNILAAAGWAGATIGSNTDTDSAIVIDTQGFESVAFAVYAGTRTDGSYLLKIRETDNPDGTTGAAEVAAYQAQDTMNTSNVVKKVGAKTTKRYCTLRITSTGVTTGCVFKGAVAILGTPKNAPVA
jgi:hypothetical protein